jgi:hypothetical protein
MKIINLFIGSVAIKNWRYKNANFLTVGTQEDNSDFTFDYFTTKNDTLSYHQEFEKLKKETDSSINKFNEKYHKTLNALCTELEKYDKVVIYVASGGLFGSICSLSLIKKFKNIEIVTSVSPLDLATEKFVLNKFRNKQLYLKIVTTPIKGEETLADYFIKLDKKITQVIKDSTCGNCFLFMQTGMSLDMGGQDCGYCNVLRWNKNIPPHNAIRRKSDICNIKETEIEAMISILEKKKNELIKNTKYEQAAMLRDKIRTLKEKKIIYK